MTKVMQAVSSFLEDEEGLTVVEYAVAGGLISAVVVASFALLGESVNTVITCLDAAVSGGDTTGC